MNKQELIEELNKTNSICGIEINAQQKQALRYAAIRMEQLDETNREESKFIYANTFLPTVKCSKCKMFYNLISECDSNNQPTNFKFCPNCGAKINKEKKDE